MRVRFFAAAVLTVLCALTSGCHHNQKVVRAAVASPPPPSAPPIQVPPASVLTAQAESMAQQAPAPAPVEEKPVEPPKPTRPTTRRPAPAPPQQPKPTQTASSGAPVADVIGQLSTGGDYSAEARKQAADFIDATQRRANSLSRQLIQAHRPAVDQIHDFLRKAQEALKSGDIDGATNLTTKAKVLLDDIEK